MAGGLVVSDLSILFLASCIGAPGEFSLGKKGHTIVIVFYLSLFIHR